jgi:hypothetical protein
MVGPVAGLVAEREHSAPISGRPHEEQLRQSEHAADQRAMMIPAAKQAGQISRPFPMAANVQNRAGELATTRTEAEKSRVTSLGRAARL